MKQKIFIFAFAFIMMLGLVPAQETKAETKDFKETMDELGWSYKNITNDIIDTYPYFIIYNEITNGDINKYVIMFNKLPICSDHPNNINGGNFVISNVDKARIYKGANNSNNIVFDREHAGSLGISKSKGIELKASNFDIDFAEYHELSDNHDLTPEIPFNHLTLVSKNIESTCTVNGSTWDECPGCGMKFNEVVLDLMEHVWVKKEELGSCTKDTKTWDECSECGAVQNEVIKPANGHVWIYKENPATCVLEGYSWEECGCGAIQNEQVIPLAEHTWEQKIEVGSCEVDSKTWDECTICGSVDNEIITPAIGHVWIYKEKSATCSMEGSSWEECGCGAIQNKQVLEMSGHVYDDDKDNVCNVCSYNRNMEQTINFLDMLPVILSLFLVFPLNFFLGINLLLLGVILFRVLKNS